MQRRSFSHGLMVPLLAVVGGCANAPEMAARHPAAFDDTRLQYAVLTGDRDTLAKDFRVNPDRSPLERGVTALTLPFAAVGESMFWPVFYGLTHRLHE